MANGERGFRFPLSAFPAFLPSLFKFPSALRVSVLFFQVSGFKFQVSVLGPNPEGIQSSSPGLRAPRYPGSPAPK